MRLLLFGCSGFIGQELVPRLLSKGHQLTIVSRQRNPIFNISATDSSIKKIFMDPSIPSEWENKGLLKALKTTQGIINLAGEPIAEKRWTKEHCEIIKASRLNTTELLIKTIAKTKAKIEVIINASAIGYYGTSLITHFDERSEYGNDFLAKLCQEWELIANKKPSSSRLIIIRIGIVIGPKGGALKKMLPIFRAGLGGPIGDGNQWMSWIHLTDICRIIENSLINKNWKGVINGVAPSPVKMSDFAKNLGAVLGRPSLLNVPGPILKILLGDGAKVVLEGQHVSSIKLKELNFEFTHPTLEEALASSTM